MIRLHGRLTFGRTWTSVKNLFIKRIIKRRTAYDLESYVVRRYYLSTCSICKWLLHMFQEISVRNDRCLDFKSFAFHDPELKVEHFCRDRQRSGNIKKINLVCNTFQHIIIVSQKFGCKNIGFIFQSIACIKNNRFVESSRLAAFCM